MERVDVVSSVLAKQMDLYSYGTTKSLDASHLHPSLSDGLRKPSWNSRESYVKCDKVVLHQLYRTEFVLWWSLHNDYEL